MCGVPVGVLNTSTKWAVRWFEPGSLPLVYSAVFGMSEFVSGLILYASALIILIGVGLVWDVWRNKKSFEMAARSPQLLCLAGTAHVTLVFLEMTAEVGGSRWK